ncbi:unnamed protein product [Victoria cruziana]
MGELAETQVCTAGTFHVWRTLLNWFSFLFQIFLQLFRGPPPFGRILAFFGLRQSLLCSPAYPPFKPLPVDVQSDDAPSSDLPQDKPIDRLTVVLDLDETLVCAYETSSLSASVRDQATEAGLKWFELECVSVDKDGEGKPRVNHITVFERPGLHEFLARTSEFAELVLFTAGLEGYARPLVDRIDVNNRISLRLYRPATISTKYREHVKDLTCLSKDLARTVIIDNNPFSFLLQPLNGIPCVPFSAGQPEDNQLIQVILPQLEQLAMQKDVRSLLYEQYHMPEWFQKHGIPTSSTV